MHYPREAQLLNEIADFEIAGQTGPVSGDLVALISYHALG